MANGVLLCFSGLPGMDRGVRVGLRVVKGGGGICFVCVIVG